MPRKPLSRADKHMNQKERELERQSDEILAPYMGKGREEGIYRELDLDRLKFREIPYDVAETLVFTGDCRQIGDNEATLSELIDEANLTIKQRKAVKLLQGIGWVNGRPIDKFGRPAKITQRMVALEMGTTQASVSVLIRNARKRINEVVPIVESRLSSDWANELFRLELAYKKRLVYLRKITRFKDGLKGFGEN
jgi:ribosomal protein S14